VYSTRSQDTGQELKNTVGSQGVAINTSIRHKKNESRVTNSPKHRIPQSIGLMPSARFATTISKRLASLQSAPHVTELPLLTPLSHQLHPFVGKLSCIDLGTFVPIGQLLHNKVHYRTRRMFDSVGNCVTSQEKKEFVDYMKHVVKVPKDDFAERIICRRKR